MGNGQRNNTHHENRTGLQKTQSLKMITDERKSRSGCDAARQMCLEPSHFNDFRFQFREVSITTFLWSIFVKRGDGKIRHQFNQTHLS